PESRQRRADSIGLAARMKAPAVAVCSAPSASTYLTPVTVRPLDSSRIACASYRSWHLPERRARRSVVTGGAPLELFGQPKPLHSPQSTQGGRPSSVKREAMAAG